MSTTGKNSRTSSATNSLFIPRNNSPALTPSSVKSPVTANLKPLPKSFAISIDSGAGVKSPNYTFGDALETVSPRALAGFGSPINIRKGIENERRGSMNLSSGLDSASPRPYSVDSSNIGANPVNDDRFIAAQRVIRKLYRKNTDLQSQVAQLKSQIQVASQSAVNLFSADNKPAVVAFLSSLSPQVNFDKKADITPSVNVFHSAEEEKEVILEAAALAEEEMEDENLINSSLTLPEDTPEQCTSIKSPTATDVVKKDPRDDKKVAFLMEQKERVIHKLQSQLEKYSNRVNELERQIRTIPTFAQNEKVKSNVSLGLNQQPSYDQFVGLHKINYASVLEKMKQMASLVQPNAFSSLKVIDNLKHSNFLLGIPKDLATFISEQTRLLAVETSARQMLDITTSVKLYASDQEKIEEYVARKLCEAEKEELKVQLKQREEIDRQIETKVITLMERLKELEAENNKLSYANTQLQNSRKISSTPISKSNDDAYLLPNN